MELDQFKEKFIEEASDFIQQLETALLDLEDHPNDADDIASVFRVMHTLKGVSSMYGFNHVSDLVHDLETIFDQIRTGKIEMTDSIFSVTFATVDHLRNLLADEKLEISAVAKKQTELLGQIETIVSQTLEPKPLQAPEAVVEMGTGLSTYYIIYYPTENQLFRGINILQLFQELTEIGDYRIVNHAFKESQPHLEAIMAWGVYLVTDKGVDAIEDVFMFVLDDCKILKVSPYNLFNSGDFIAKLDALYQDDGTQDQKEIRSEIAKTIETINTSVPAETPQVESVANVEQIESAQTETAPDIQEANNSVDQKQAEADATLHTDVTKQATARISIDATHLDRLMYLVSELVITKSQLNSAVENKNYTHLQSIAEKIDSLSTHFRDNALKIRLVPVSEIIVPFKRMVRDLSKQLGKEISFITQGIDTELDKSIIDRLAEPIMHILRNCVDHGIETPDVRQANNKEREGSIKFTSYYSGANVFIQIQDDGAGMDPEKLRKKAIERGIIKPDEVLTEAETYDLIFQPGFSTASSVTDISGRGVGMDVVRKKIAEVRGEVDVNSELGLGTFITIKLHQTLSIIDTLLLQVDNAHYLVPVSDVEFCDQETHQVLYKNANRQYEVEDELIPFVSLRDIFHSNDTAPKKEKVIVIRKNDKRLAIVVDRIVGEHQAVLKPLGKVLQKQDYLAGASILGDGALALMLDTAKLQSSPPVLCVN